MIQFNIQCEDNVNINQLHAEIKEYLSEISEKYSGIDITLSSSKDASHVIHHIENNHYLEIEATKVKGKLVFLAKTESVDKNIILGGVSLEKNGDLKVYSQGASSPTNGLTHRVFKRTASILN